MPVRSVNIAFGMAWDIGALAAAGVGNAFCAVAGGAEDAMASAEASSIARVDVTIMVVASVCSAWDLKMYLQYFL
jgi:hypothetical protein